MNSRSSTPAFGCEDVVVRPFEERRCIKGFTEKGCVAFRRLQLLDDRKTVTFFTKPFARRNEPQL